MKSLKPSVVSTFTVIIFSGLFSYFLGELMDALFIAFFIFVDVTLGFYQEYRSEKTSRLLEKYSSYSS